MHNKIASLQNDIKTCVVVLPNSSIENYEGIKREKDIKFSKYSTYLRLILNASIFTIFNKTHDYT